MSTVENELRQPISVQADSSDPAAGSTGDDRKRRDISIDERTRPDDHMVADAHVFGDHGWTTDVTAISDVDGTAYERSLAPGKHPDDGVVRVDQHAGTDVAVIADRQSARAIKKRERPDPRVLPDFDIPVDVAVVIDRRAAPEVQRFRSFDAIE